MVAEKHEVDREWSRGSGALAAADLVERFTVARPTRRTTPRRSHLTWQYPSFDLVPRDKVTRAIRRANYPIGLKVRLSEFAEVFIAAAGVIVVLMILLAVSTMLRGIHALRRG